MDGARLGTLVGRVLIEGAGLGAGDGADVGGCVLNLQSFPSVMRKGPSWSPAYRGTLQDNVIVHVVDGPTRFSFVLSSKGPTIVKESPSLTGKACITLSLFVKTIVVLSG